MGFTIFLSIPDRSSNFDYVMKYICSTHEMVEHNILIDSFNLHMCKHRRLAATTKLISSSAQHRTQKTVSLQNQLLCNWRHQHVTTGHMLVLPQNVGEKANGYSLLHITELLTEYSICIFWSLCRSAFRPQHPTSTAVLRKLLTMCDKLFSNMYICTYVLHYFTHLSKYRSIRYECENTLTLVDQIWPFHCKEHFW